jgi:hypothetical protein
MMTLGDRQATLAAYNVPTHQSQVDEIQAQIRADILAGRRSLFKPAPPAPRHSEDVLEERIGEELELVIRQLAQVGDMLADDPILVSRHAMQLQSIDLMQQVLGHLGRVVAAANKAEAVDNITLTELKSRLKRQALRPIAD